MSLCVRERADHICQAQLGDCHEILHASHYIGRGNQSTRYMADNLLCLCATCHALVENNPGLHYRVFTQVMGEGIEEMIQERRRELYRGVKKDIPSIAKHYREELKAMRESRSNGHQGILEFTSW